MIITKLIEIGVNIQDCIALHTDLDNNLLRLLEDRFVGRCVRLCYILRINRIVKCSPCVINPDGPADYGVVNVVFETSAIVYLRGEILNGCRVVSKEALKGISDTIICSTEYADIQLNNHPLFESVRQGQLISVRVGETKYTLGAQKIAVNAVPLVLSRTPTVFRYVPSAIPSDFADFVASFYDRLSALESEIAGVREKNAQAWSVFGDMLYAYESPQPTPAGARAVSILDLIRAPPDSECYVTRDPRIHPSSPDVYVYSDASSIPDVPAANIVRDVPPITIMVTLLDEYYNMLRSIVEYINIYSTQELLDSHRNLWLIFRKMKKQ
jgi:hypothetical protein